MPFLRVSPPTASLRRPPASCPAGAIRLLHSSRALHRDDIGGRNHYETLRVATDATPADIKKSFYSLSKAHHPDHNREDPQASTNFARISEAYSILGTPAKRAAYDRDVLRLHERHHSHAHHHHKGSYHSTGPAGGRPASGLSRRRGTFQGPPPSFYRSGGWGKHGEKRKAAHEGSTSGGSFHEGPSKGSASGEPGPGRPHSAGASNVYGSASSEAWSASGPGTMGGMGPGQDPFGHRDEVPHFDRDGHTRTHQREDLRRAWRARSERDIPTGPTGLFNGFWVVSGVVAVGVFIPLLFMARGPDPARPKGGQRKGG